MSNSNYKKRIVALLGVAAVLATTACSSTTPNSSSDKPVTGGTLKVLASGDVDRLDPQLSAYVAAASVMRAVSRQLISYETVSNANDRIVPKGDLATEVPKPTNNGLTYTFTLRDGVTWDAPGGPKPLVATDFERGMKRLCNPYLSGAMLGYYIDLIQGMSDFCKGFQSVAPKAASMKDYIDKNDISGIAEPDDKTIVINLTQPAGDFVYMLSINEASPAPEEVLNYLPDSPEYRSNFISSGPYTVDKYTPDATLQLKRNPSWKASSDPLRKAYVDRIEMTMGVDNNSAMQQLQAGSADMLFDIVPTAAQVQQLKTANDPKLSTLPTGGVDQFLWINTKSPNNGGALKNILVREALEYAMDKAAVVQTMGGKGIAAVQNGVFGPGILGQKDFDPYPTDGSKGDPKKAKELLAQAGYPNGLTLKFPYRNLDPQPAIAQTMQASLEKAGFTIELSPVPPTDYYANFITNRDNATNGVWDIAQVGWSPDWQGGAARSVFQPQFTFNGTPQTYNYLDYNNDKADGYAAQALKATDAGQVADLWHKADEAVMKDAIIIPVASGLAVLYHSARVGGFVPYALSAQGDWTNVWIR
jgi:peptide/nickel transport system substrate-binding protein